MADEEVIQIYHFFKEYEEFTLNFLDILLFRRFLDFLIVFFVCNSFLILLKIAKKSIYVRIFLIFITLTQIHQIVDFCRPLIINFVNKPSINIPKSDKSLTIKQISAFIGTLYHYFKSVIDPIKSSFENENDFGNVFIAFWLLVLFYFFWTIDDFDFLLILVNFLLFSPHFLNCLLNHIEN